MNYAQTYKFALCVVAILVAVSEGKTEIGDYIVDCSACNSVPVQGVSSYSCKVRCEAEGEANTNLTEIYDMLVQLSEELESTKQRQRETEAELNATKLRQRETDKDLKAARQELKATREVLETDVAFNAQLTDRVLYVSTETLLFDNVITNIGDAYDETTGIFRVPRNGTYSFTLVSMTSDGNHYAWLTLNGERLSVTHGLNKWRTGAATFNKKLVAGDEVWVEAGAGNRTYVGPYSVFSGNLIRADF